jgi:signal recognition particle subunit SRP54
MGLKESLTIIFNRIKNAVFLDRKELDEIIKDLQKALISSDVDVELVNNLCKEIRELALREDLRSIDKREILTKLIYENLVKILGEKSYELKLEKGDRVLLIGLYGSGKTTTAIKLANYYAKKGFKTCVVGLDVHRPAASEQLLQYAKNTPVKIFVSEEKKAIEIWKKFEDEIKRFDIVFIDSAGRDALNEELVKEIKEIYNEVKPSHVLLIIPADIGQAAKKQAEFFSKVLNIDGIVLTRMDGTAKAGGALASCKQTNAKVFFIGVGEKVNDIERFDPKSYLQRILGLGDLETLMEKIKLTTEEKQIKKEEFTLIDFYEQIKNMQKLGPLKKIIEFIPGISGLKIPSEILDIQEQKLRRWKYAIDSMTKEERENPDIINSSRLSRISKGSHVPVSEIKEMLKQYKLVKEFVKGGFDEKSLLKLRRRFGRFL